MSVRTATLDANSETFEIAVPFGANLAASMTITGTITVTWTARVDGGSNAPTVKDSSDNDEVYTASDHFYAVGSGMVYIATASGVSGGSCDIEASVGRAS